MVRKKEAKEVKPRETAERRVKVVKRESVDSYEQAEPERRPVRRASGGNGTGRVVLALVLVLALLGVGWFATQWLLGNKDGNLLASLLSGRGSKLVGEEDGHVNFLLMGNAGDPSHDGPDLTDTIMVASYDTDKKFLSLFSLPRDLYVSVPNNGSMKINAVYETGKRKLNDGPGTLAKTVEEVLGIKIPYYMRIDFAGFSELVDKLGGISVSVKKDLSDPFYPAPNDGYQLVEFKAGDYTMDGENALKYVRSRKTTSDFDRAIRQQGVMVSIRNKAMDLELLTAPSKAMEILGVLDNHFETNLKKSEVERMLSLFVDLDPANVSSKVFDDSPAGLLYATRVGEAYALKPINDDYSKLAEFVANTLAQAGEEPSEEEEVSMVPLKIEVLNGTNITGLAGKVAEKVKPLGFSIVRAANNPTKGVKESVIYDNTGGKRLSDLKKLAEILNATISTEKVTMSSGVEARLVVGETAQDLVK
jgi:LCP family protein required for cell wall assembly